jgi:hypothetical protein
MSDPLGGGRRRRAQMTAALLEHRENMARKYAVRVREKAARAEAGRKVLHARAAVDGLCSAVEATQVAVLHREFLEHAMRELGDAIGALCPVLAIESPVDGFTGIIGGYQGAVTVSRARALRNDKDRFADFLSALTRSLTDEGVTPRTIRYLQDELGRQAAAEISAPTALASRCEAAQRVLERGIHHLQGGSSLAHAWTQVRTAEDILDGATILLVPAMCENVWLSSDDHSPACLCATAGAGMMTRGFGRMQADDSSSQFLPPGRLSRHATDGQHDHQRPTAAARPRHGLY